MFVSLGEYLSGYMIIVMNSRSTSMEDGDDNDDKVELLISSLLKKLS